jgi:two-component system, OmpR family, sensor histidine kinase BaeS
MRPRFGFELGLRSKLFLVLLGAILLAAVATSIPVRGALHVRVSGEFDDRALERVRSRLLAAYELHGNWDFLRRDPSRWSNLLRDAAILPPGPFQPSAGPAPKVVVVSVPLALLDAGRRFVIGDSQIGPNTPMRPVITNGQIVGWLAGPPRAAAGRVQVTRESDPPPTRWIMGTGAVLVAALAASLLTRWLLRPVRHIAAATHRLAAGDYATRLKEPAQDEIGRLADDFNRLARVLEKTEQMRRAFMADMSHELRTPIAVLRGELEAIEDGVREPTVENMRSLQNEVETIGKLVNDLYQLSLADVGALTYGMTVVDIAELLRARLRVFGERLNERRIVLESNIPDDRITVNGDETRLQQLFGNLMENSVRYTSAGGLARLSCHAEAACVIIDLHDSEPGVPHELLPHLFERFFRVEASRNREKGGAGLGLAICKSIVEAHGGTIGARESPLGGLWVTVTLPIAK